jgi:ABC-2 type transport system permease protein
MMSTLRIHYLETRSEFLKMFRMPAYVIPTLTFPVVFYLFFGVTFGSAKAAKNATMAEYLIATYGAFGVIGASLFGFGVAVAIERGQGWLQLKRATPMPLSAWFGAKLAMAVLFSAIIAILLFTMGATVGGVRFEALEWLRLFATLILGALPFCAMGLAIGYFAGPNSAPAIVNLLYLPMAFVSGLWIPLAALPKFFRAVAPALPPYHFGQLALLQIGVGDGSAMTHVAALIGFTILFLILATIGYRRDEGKLYG